MCIRDSNISEGGYAIVMLSSVNDKGMMSYDKSSITALPIVKNKKKAEKIISNTNFSDIDQIANQYGLQVESALSVNLNNPVISGVGNEPSVVGYAMGINKETTSQAIIGESGVFYIYVTERRKAASLDNYMSLINNINSSRTSQIRSNAYNALKDKAEIVDYRATFY